MRNFRIFFYQGRGINIFLIFCLICGRIENFVDRLQKFSRLGSESRNPGIPENKAKVVIVVKVRYLLEEFVFIERPGINENSSLMKWTYWRFIFVQQPRKPFWMGLFEPRTDCKLAICKCGQSFIIASAHRNTSVGCVWRMCGYSGHIHILPAPDMRPLDGQELRIGIFMLINSAIKGCHISRARVQLVKSVSWLFAISKPKWS